MKQIIQIRCKNNKKIKDIAIGSSLSDVFDEFNLDEDTFEANVEESNLNYETLTDNQTHVNSLPHLIHSLDETKREDMQKLVDSGWASIKCS